MFVTTLISQDHETCGFITNTRAEAHAYINSLSDLVRVRTTEARIYRSGEPRYHQLGARYNEDGFSVPLMGVSRDSQIPEVVKLGRAA